MLNERKRWVAAVSHGRPEVRITMTYPAIESSRHVAFLLAGKEKAAMLATIRTGGSQVACRVTAAAWPGCTARESPGLCRMIIGPVPSRDRRRRTAPPAPIDSPACRRRSR